MLALCLAACFGGGLSNFPFYFENVIEFLDSPGEWFLDRHTGRLSYLPKPGERIDAFDAEMPRLEQLLVVRGTADRPVRVLRFRDLAFQLTDWALPKEGFMPDQCGFFDTDNSKKGFPVPASAIDFQYATGCELQNCRVAGAGGFGIRLREGCSSNTVTDCLIENVGAIRHNDNHPEDQSWGTNYFDIQPNRVSATANIVRQAGPNPAAASPR